MGRLRVTCGREHNEITERPFSSRPSLEVADVTEPRQQLFRASAMVTEMAVTVILGVLAGGWLDGRFNTSPLFLLLLSLLAFVIGMVRMIRALNAREPAE